MCNCVLVLFFAMVLRIVLFTFVAKLFTFALLFLQVFLARCHFLVFIVFLAAQFASFCVAGYVCCLLSMLCYDVLPYAMLRNDMIWYFVL